MEQCPNWVRHHDCEPNDDASQHLSAGCSSLRSLDWNEIKGMGRDGCSLDVRSADGYQRIGSLVRVRFDCTGRRLFSTESRVVEWRPKHSLRRSVPVRVLGDTVDSVGRNKQPHISRHACRGCYRLSMRRWVRLVLVDLLGKSDPLRGGCLRAYDATHGPGHKPVQAAVDYCLLNLIGLFLWSGRTHVSEYDITTVRHRVLETSGDRRLWPTYERPSIESTKPQSTRPRLFTGRGPIRSMTAEDLELHRHSVCLECDKD